MNSLSKLYLERAENELLLVETLFQISSKNLLKKQFSLGDETFYSAVISHSYYCIFYCAKAILVEKNIRTKTPNEHKKTYLEFKNLVKSGFIDENLIKIYSDLMIKAENLLSIFLFEKRKRGKFTYHKLPQANKFPAKESIENASLSFKSINNILERCNEN